MATPIDPLAITYSATGQNAGAGWFGPLAPMPPTAPPEVAGRIWDFPSGYNLNQRPRAYEPIGFHELRALADSYDVLRLIIETRKDQMSALDWSIQPRKEAPRGRRSKGDPRIDAAVRFFQRPDGTHPWDQWLRLLLEDMLVIDAPALYVRRSRGGALIGLEPLDGATIKRVIDDWGRTPEPPAPAYQQVLKGLPAINYTTDEIVYAPRNPRTHKAYGYSPVEQIIVTINIALRRQLFQLQYYTEGNVPEALIGVPDTWTPEQVANFQAWWDSVLEGNTAQRRHAKFVPGGVAKTYIPTKEPEQKSLYDEWLARICCFAFSISPEAFVAVMNRATAETAQQRALAEGLAPSKRWAKLVMDGLLARFFDGSDLEFRWADEPEPDPDRLKDRLTAYVAHGILSINEARREIGLEPVEGGDEAMLISGSQATPVADVGAMGEEAPGDDRPAQGALDADDTAGVGKSAPAPFVKAARPLRVSRTTKVQNRQRRRLARALAKVFRGAIDPIARQIEAALNRRAAKAASDEDDQRRAIEQAERAMEDAVIDAEAEAIARMIDLDGLEFAVMPTQEAIEAVARDAGMRIVAQLRLGGSVDEITQQVHEKAREFAQRRAAEMVGMRRTEDGRLIRNPDARWAITDETRRAIKGIVVEAIDPGLDPSELRERLRDAAGFSPERADLVARTELARAHSQGNLIAMKESAEVVGTFQKSWLTAGDDRVSEECAANQAQGAIPLESAFQSGEDAPPAHPRCRCVLVPVLDPQRPQDE